MNDLEERLRAVTRAAAGQITAERIPPPPTPARGRLRRTVPGLAQLTGNHSPRWRRWQTRLAPVVAAAAVVGLVAGSLSLVHAVGGRFSGHAAITGPSASDGRPPPYYVALTDAKLGIARPGGAEVRSTATGAVISHVPQSTGEEYFGVSGASDDRTFVLGAATTNWARHSPPHTYAVPARFYLLRFDAATRTAKVTPLPVPELSHVMWFTLSPDGTELAVFSATPATVTARVYSVASGAARSWTVGTHGGRYVWVPGTTAYWVAGGRLAFSLGWEWKGERVDGLLNTNTAGGSLFASTRTFAPGVCTSMDVVSPNGKLIFNATGRSGPSWLQLCTFGRARLDPVRPITLRCPDGSIATYDPLFYQTMWVSPTGRALIASVVCGNARTITIGLASAAGGTVRPLPGSSVIPRGSPYPGSPVSW
jgi:hypothetical protein